jgi:tetratricopeptide (TPR) repeat protein
LVQAAPRNLVSRIWLARAALSLGDERTAASAVDPKAVDGSPNALIHYCRLARIHIELHNLDQARRYLQAATELLPTYSHIWGLLGDAYSSLNDSDSAIRCYERQFESAPTPRTKVFALERIALMLAVAGRKDAAISMFRQVLSLSPHNGCAYYWLTDCHHTSDPSDPLVMEIRQLLASPTVQSDRSDLHYALGAVYDRSGETGTAFAHFQLANQLRAASFPRHGCQRHGIPLIADRAIGVRARSLQTEVNVRSAIFTSDMIASYSQHGFQEDYLICVVGMPRSGTTLVEQVLGAHSDVCALGERQDFAWLRRTLPSVLRTHKPFPECCTHLTPKLIRSLGESIRERFSEVAGQSPRVVTKLPFDFLDLGLIRILFPQARIIHCVRDPLDTCLSCYMQNFASLDFSTNLQQIAGVYKSYRHIMKHWSSVLPSSSILDVSYEEHVAAKETITRTMCEFCDIPFQVRCLEFYDHVGVVQTASSFQVRRPIYRTSLKRSDRYREFLGPLLELALPDAAAQGVQPTSRSDV